MCQLDIFHSEIYESFEGSLFSCKSDKYKTKNTGGEQNSSIEGDGIVPLFENATFFARKIQLDAAY